MVHKKGKRSLAVVLCVMLCLEMMFGIMPAQKVKAQKNQAATIKQIANVVIFAHFAGDRAESDKAFFADSTNAARLIGYYNGSSEQSFTNYMSKISYGKLQVENIFPQYDGKSINSCELPYSEAEAKTKNIDDSIIRTVIANVPGVSNQVVDYDGDGYIDNLTIVLKSMDFSAPSGTTLVSHMMGLYSKEQTWSGKYIGNINMINTYSMEGDGTNPLIGSNSAVLAHEFLHSLGFPDLYTTKDEYPVYSWDIMAMTDYRMTYPLAYTRMKFGGWENIDTINTSQTLTFSKPLVENGKQAYIIKSPLSDSEFFVIEFRKKESIGKCDSGIVGSGLIVYRVNTAVTGLSNYHGQEGIHIFGLQPGDTNYSTTSKLANIGYAFLSRENKPGIGNADFDATIEQGALTYSDGSNSGIVISNVSSSAGDTMTCTVTIPKAEDCDTWEDTLLPDDVTGYQMGRFASVFANEGKVYGLVTEPASAYSSKYKMTAYSYNGSAWTKMTSVSDLNYISEVSNMFTYKGDVYILTSEGGNTCLRKLTASGISAPVATITGTNSMAGSVVYNGKLYMTVAQSSGGWNTSIGVYSYDGTKTEKICSTAEDKAYAHSKMCEINGKIYVSAVDASCNIYLYQLTGNKLTQLTSYKPESNMYDMVAHEGYIYIASNVKVGSNTVMQLTKFDVNSKTSENTVLDVEVCDPKISAAEGNLYVLVQPAKGNDATNKTKVYRYDSVNKKVIQEGTAVAATVSGMQIASNGNALYVAYSSNLDDDTSVVIKKKVTTNTLQTISITQTPKKTAYKVGETFSLDGLMVTANYKLDSKVLSAGSYSVTGISTAAPGDYYATVTYNGKSNTFPYTVLSEGTEVDASTPITSVSISENGNAITSKSLETGKTASFTAIVAPANTTNSKQITWTSSDTTVATVTASGTDKVNVTVKTVKAGNVTITARTSNGKIATVNITVTTPTTNPGTTNPGTTDPGTTNPGTTNPGTTNPATTVPDVTVSYRTHVQSFGWQAYVTNGTMSGTSGKSKRLEGINISVSGNQNLGIRYRTHIQTYGWQEWKYDGAMSGTSGESKRLEAIQIEITGADKDKYDVYYRVHAQSYGWLGWAKNGAQAGTAGQSKRLEGIQILVLKKGQTPSDGQVGYSFIGVGKSSTANPNDGLVNYMTHVQTYGDQRYVSDGSVSGTFGEAKRLEGIRINVNNEKLGLSGGITYQTHVQTYGWLNWSSNGDFNGTHGQAKRLEAIKIRLTGELANKYDVYYRVHSQTFGWLGWAKNGASAGTAGYAKRLEGIQIVLLPKGSAAPSTNPGTAGMAAYISK